MSTIVENGLDDYVYMKVFFVDPQSYLNLAVYDKSLLSELGENIDVYFLCSSQYDGGEINGVVIKPLFFYNKKKGIKKILSYVFSLLKLVRLVVVERPDVIHIQWLKIEHLDYWLYRFIRRFFKTKLVFTAHNILPHNSGRRFFNIYKKFYSLVDAIIVHDKTSKDDLSSEIHVDEGKIYVIRHGILSYKTDEELIQKEKADLTKRYHLDDSKLLLSVVGFQNKYKGTDVLLKVWSSNEMLKNNRDCCLLIAGRCKELDFLNDISDCQNIFVEDAFISTERLVAILQMTDVLLLPYIKISQSGVLLTAIEYGTPFLVTNVGGLSEPLQYGNVGWEIPQCDEELLCNALIRLVSNHKDVKEKRSDEQGWNNVREAYSWVQIGEKTTELYKVLTSKSIKLL